MKDVERVNALNKMLLNANVVAYGAMVDLIKRTGRLDLDMSSVGHIDDFPAEIRIFTDNGLICLSITSVYLSGEDNLMVDGYDENNDKVDGVNVYYDQIDEVVYLVKIILSVLMLMRSRRIQWNGCRVHDAASGLWSGSSITGGLRRGAVVCYRVVGSPEPQIR